VTVAREHPTLPVVVLSARDQEIDLALGVEAGAVDCITDPFRLAELLARIAIGAVATFAVVFAISGWSGA